QISTRCGVRLGIDSTRTIAMLYGSWPVEHPADQSRTGAVVAGSFKAAATRSAMNVKCAGSRKNAVWLTVLRSISSCIPGPVGSALSTRSLNRVKLANPRAWSRERSRAWSRPMRCGPRGRPDRLRRNATIGAKSFSDHGSDSGGGGGPGGPGRSGSATSEPPTVAGAARVQRPQRGEHAVDVEDQQEPVLVTDQPPDERGRLAQAELGRRLDLLGGELEHVGDPVDQQAGDVHLVALARLDHQDARRAGRL